MGGLLQRVGHVGVLDPFAPQSNGDATVPRVELPKGRHVLGALLTSANSHYLVPHYGHNAETVSQQNVLAHEHRLWLLQLLGDQNERPANLSIPSLGRLHDTVCARFHRDCDADCLFVSSLHFVALQTQAIIDKNTP
jgi:hypothetical protein